VATKDLVDTRKTKITEYDKHQAKQAKYLSVQRVKQDKQLPGERERIVYGLSKRSDEEIIGLIKRGILYTRYRVSKHLVNYFLLALCLIRKLSDVDDARKNTIPSTSQV
jgi:hypothetical protein